MLSVNFTFLFVLANLLILYFVVKKFLFGRVGQILEQRAKAVEDNLRAGEESRIRGEEYEHRRAEELSTVKSECRTFTEESRRLAQKESADIIENAKQEARLVLESAREQAARERNEIMKKFNDQAAELIISAATAVIGANMDSGRNRALIDDFINNRGAA